MEDLKILQINLNGCQAAQALMDQVAFEQAADVVVVSEQYNGHGRRWYEDLTARSAVYIPSRRSRMPVAPPKRGKGWICVEIGGLRLFSVYFSPNADIEQYVRDLHDLETAIRAAKGPVVVAGDFNAKAAEWGSKKTDRRGRMLAETASALELVTCNRGSCNTFQRANAGSVIDVTFADDATARKVTEWEVLDCWSHSDHKYISYTIRKQTLNPNQSTRVPRGWSTRKLCEEALRLAIASRTKQETGRTAAGKADALNKLAAECCDATMPRRAAWTARRPAYWWTDEIDDLRKECLKTSRQHQRQRQSTEAHQRYREARKNLRLAIKNSKTRCWDELCQSVNDDPWGLPYKMVRKKLREPSRNSLDAEKLDTIVDGLFPEDRSLQTLPRATEAKADSRIVPVFTEEELLNATRRLKTGKAPGPDGIPNKVIKVLAEEAPSRLLEAYNSCLQEGTFVTKWKRQSLVLVPKERKPSGHPTSYRPLCLIDGFGKVLERLILGRLQEHLENHLSEHQHGFRPGRSTIGAIEEVVSTVRRGWGTGTAKSSSHTIIVTLDIKNAFNTARWHNIIGALREEFKIPEYLQNIMESYFSDRTLMYGNGQKRRLSAGVPQGSVLGPAMWNAMYNGLLRMQLPRNTNIVGFADDVAVLITAKTKEGLKAQGDEALRRVHRWMQEHGLELAVEKTEAVFFTRRRKLTPPLLNIAGRDITYTRSLRYLGVQLDDKLTFAVHTEKAAAKAARTAEQLARLMPNIGGPRPNRRKLYHQVVHSTLLYGAPIWTCAMRVEKSRRNLARVQRKSALRLISAYRTVSEDAALVLASSPPIDLLADERQAAYRGLIQEGDKIMKTWQLRWERGDKGAWTRELIGDLNPWVNRKHGELNFHLTQLLSGHGCFGAYIHKIGKEATPECHHCEATLDDARHTIFECQAWLVERESLKDSLGTDIITPTSMVPTMLRDNDSWTAWSLYASIVMRTKESAERERERTLTARRARP